MNQHAGEEPFAWELEPKVHFMPTGSGSLHLQAVAVHTCYDLNELQPGCKTVLANRCKHPEMSAIVDSQLLGSASGA